MSSHRFTVGLGMLLTAALAGAQTLQMPKVEIESDAKADFTAFKTFRWKDSQVPADNPVVHTSTTVYVERGLTAKGLTKKTDGDADLQVRYYTAKDESIKGTGSQQSVPLAGNPTSASTHVDFSKQTSGLLVLELYRSSDMVLVWKGSTVTPAVDKNRLDTEVATAVRRLMAKYPPKPPSK